MKTTGNSRREFLRNIGLGTSAVLLASCSQSALTPALSDPLDSDSTSKTDGLAEAEPKGLPDGLNPNNFHLYNEKPLALETKRSKLSSSPITPASVLFVRNNLPMPDASIVQNPDEWVLEIKGANKARSVTVAELKNMDRSFETSVLQCSGNGRAFFEHGASGSQWSVGAAGCVVWCGARVSEVAKALGGPVAEARFLTSTGGETLPEGVDPKTAVVERSVPLEKGLNDCLLAWEMNGEPIPITHGGPLRLIVPGYFGCNNIKYVKTLAFTESESPAKIQQTGYRFRPIGEKGNPSQPSMWRMPVKSWINGPGADDSQTLAGKVHFHGVAFSGERGVQSVEVSLDKGKTWQPATFDGPSMGLNAWRPFQFTAELGPGEVTVVSRATDTHGDTQPQYREENERGYRYNAWEETALTIQVVDSFSQSEVPSVQEKVAVASLSQQTQTLSPAAERGREVFTTTAQPSCGACHSLSEAGTSAAVGPDLDTLQPNADQVRKAVENGVGIMPAFGDRLNADQIDDLVQYLQEVRP